MNLTGRPFSPASTIRVVPPGRQFKPTNGPTQEKHDFVTIHGEIGIFQGAGTRGLTKTAASWYNSIMNEIIEVLRKTIADSGISHARIEREIGVNRLSIGRFMNGKTLLSLDQAELLAEYFGLELRPRRKRSK